MDLKEWQKYVKEEMDKANKAGSEPTRISSPAASPTINKDRFIIHRKDAASQPASGASGPARLNRPADQAAQSPPITTAPMQGTLYPAAGVSSQMPVMEDAARPKASPFISVSDVWKAAGKSAPAAQARPAQARNTAHAENRQEMSPASAQAAISPAPKNVSPAVLDDSLQRAPREQTREEILERLFNPTISLEEAAKIMGVCKATVRRYTAMGILPHYRTPGNQRRFKLNDIILFLENQKK